MKFLILLIGLNSATTIFEDLALKWAKAHNLPKPGVTCVEKSALKAHCDVSSKGNIYPLSCDSGDGCFYNNRRK